MVILATIGMCCAGIYDTHAMERLRDRARYADREPLTDEIRGERDQPPRTDAVGSPKAEIDDDQEEEEVDIFVLDEDSSTVPNSPSPDISELDNMQKVTLFAPEKRGVRLSGGIGILRGDSTFQIGGNVVLADGVRGTIHFPLSELEFPLDVVIGSIEASVDFADRWTFRGGLSKNVTSDAGKTKDSDWGILNLAGVPGFGPRSLEAVVP